ncbi:CubicO group peptidase (beta-lactamase class C family) [Diaminobutyricimonas aerilata]|uniref:CubicO group peptidase (Beta-lactamase class C family) n=1 Tax=Diaminobutyricimonas aerilata TaxID=1162967 RepID=A0A2M9CNL6_9MICO|nr:serine hydrolase [Diaminobutyricimonas aerilata]PJJ73493.1 CubicO group peptidase (beta-lactamase class C family) [Diaminobutyricimonas aerilata]
MSVLPTSTPERQGIPSAAVAALLDELSTVTPAVHSIVIVRHGHVVTRAGWAPYRPDRPHAMYSVSKSFTATAIGMLVDDGLLDLDARVLDLFADSAPEHPASNLRQVTVRHLLTMSIGSEEPMMRGLDEHPERAWMQTFLASPFTEEPGAVFQYNSGATFALSAIVQKVTGQRTLDFLRPRLLDPLSITDADWQQSPEGIDVGGWGLSIDADAMARFGELYLRGGVWQGERLLSQEWVDQATSTQISTAHWDKIDSQQGYGFQFWRARHGYRADGAYGQVVVVLPEQDAVVAITAGVADTQRMFDAIWAHLLPAFDTTAEPVELPVLSLPRPDGAPVTDRLVRVRLESNSLGVTEVTVADEGLVVDGVPVPGASDGWVDAELPLPAPLAARLHMGISDDGRGEPHPVGVAAAWTSPATLEVRMWWTAGPFGSTLTIDTTAGTARVAYSFTDGNLTPATVTATVEEPPA